MDGDVPPKDNVGGGDSSLPPVGEGVLVSHEGRERMAYRDAAGLWRDHFNGEILKGEVRTVRRKKL